jgi:hypothetical protein
VPSGDRPRSSAEQLRRSTERDRERIERGERPLYHVEWAASPFGGVDVTILELPLIHLFVPDLSGVVEGARVLIARTLRVDAADFDMIPSLEGAG